MELKNWVEQERGRAAALAAHLRVPPSFVSKMVSGEKPVPIAHMAVIEAFTQGAVTRKDLRPDDWQSIWPELADTQPAAEPPTAAVATPQPLPPEDEAAEPLQPMDLAGQCDNNRRAPQQDAEAGDGPLIQPPDIDGEAEEAQPLPAAFAFPPNNGNGQPGPPPDLAGQAENGPPAAPSYQPDDGEPVLVLEETDDRKAA